MPFKSYTDFESILKGVRDSDKKNNTYEEYKNVENTSLAVLPKKLFVLMISLVNQLFFTGEKCNQ